MLVELEKGTIEALKGGDLYAATIDGAKRDISALRFPAALVAIRLGKFEKAGQAGIKWNATVVVWLAFKEFKSETDRRQGLYSVIEGVVGVLALQTLGLGISPLLPERFYDVTGEEEARMGIETYQLDLSTSWTTSKADPDGDAADLLKIALEYFLQEPEDDGQADAADVVEPTE